MRPPQRPMCEENVDVKALITAAGVAKNSSDQKRNVSPRFVARPATAYLLDRSLV